MQYRQLGERGPVVSRVAFGNSLTAGNQLDDELAIACVRAAYDAGVTTFDTADVYAEGRAEEVLGRALAGVPRESVVVTTKVGRGGGLSRASILAGIDGSLRRLGTDHVDVYQAHFFDDAVPVEETMAAFADVVAAGKARCVGVSEWAAPELAQAARAAAELGIALVSNQPQYNLLWRVIEAEVLPACAELGIGQLVWSPLAGGVLTGKYRPGQPYPAGSRAVAAHGGRTSLDRWSLLEDDVLQRVAELAGPAAEVGMDLPQLALAWVLRNPLVTGAVIGASRPEHVTRNLRALERELPDDLCARIDEVLGPRIVTDPGLTLSRMVRAAAPAR